MWRSALAGQSTTRTTITSTTLLVNNKVAELLHAEIIGILDEAWLHLSRIVDSTKRIVQSLLPDRSTAAVRWIPLPAPKGVLEDLPLVTFIVLLALSVLLAVVALCAVTIKTRNQKCKTMDLPSSSEAPEPFTNHPQHQQQLHHEKAYEYTSAALEQDEAGAPELAVEWYALGAAELIAALRVMHADKQDQKAAQSLNDKMRQNLARIEDRMRALAQIGIVPRGRGASVSGVHVGVGRNGLSGNRKSRPSSASSDTFDAAAIIERSSSLSQLTANKSIIQRSESVLNSTGPLSSHHHKLADSQKSKAGSWLSKAPHVPPLTRDVTNRDDSRKKRTASPPPLSPSPAHHSFQSGVGKNVDPKLAEIILNEIVDRSSGVGWVDIAGLETAKRALKEIVILPSLRPELFTGLRQPAKGLLLFGPPGTGKTMLAKAVATESKATFFQISASSLTSKYVGDSEKLVRALFALAKELQPSIVFIDEVDSILCERSENEHEASRRLKTEFLLQFDGVSGLQNERVLIMGATNRPQELDEAARRRFSKRIYVPLPEKVTRLALLRHLLSKHTFTISDKEFDQIGELTKGFSGSDLSGLAQEAAFGPLRELGDAIASVDMEQVRPIQYIDFQMASKVVRPSVGEQSVRMCEEWNASFGCTG